MMLMYVICEGSMPYSVYLMRVLNIWFPIIIYFIKNILPAIYVDLNPIMSSCASYITPTVSAFVQELMIKEYDKNPQVLVLM